MNNYLAFISGIGVQEILLIGLFVLVFFGAKKIPDFMRGLGKGMKDFKEALHDTKKEVDSVQKEATKVD